MANVYRADQAGSLIAPAVAAGSPGAEAVKALLAMQKECGVDVVSDGQVLRASPCSIFAAGVAGVRSDFAGQATSSARSSPYVAGPLQRQARLTAAEVDLLKGVATATFKITLPTPSVAAIEMFREGVTDAHYPTRHDLAMALAAILREEIKDLIAAGVPYIQLDGPAYELGADRAGAARLGNVAELLRLDAEAFKDLGKSDKVALALRLPLPRDPNGPSVQTQGSAEKRAAMLESALTHMPIDRFLIEFPAQSTAADFAPLRALPAGKMAVLGLVDPLAPRADDVDPLLDTLDLAVAAIGAEQLALSPRCGFAQPHIAREPHAYEAQRRSLTLTVEAARRFWGFEM
jgi:5-methyltetrahydropteroyltriglutamate--homocysteine methyltransferase